MFEVQTPFGWLDVASFVLTVAALIWTFLEARSARKAAESAETASDLALKAVRAAELRLANDGLMVALGRIQTMIREIEQASASQSRDLIRYSLVQFGKLATELSTRLTRHEGNWEALTVALDTEAVRALDAKDRLMRNEKLLISKNTLDVRTALDKLSLMIESVQTELSTPTNGVDDVQ